MMMRSPSATQLVADAREAIEHLTGEQLAGELHQDGVVLVDLREQDEREVHGVIPGGVHIPRGMLEFCADPALPIHVEGLVPSRRIILYCAAGNRSALATLTLKAMGFPDVAHLDGGFPSWQRAGGAVEPPSAGPVPWSHLLQR